MQTRVCVRVSPGRMRSPGLKVSTPAHTKQLGWCVEFEFRVTHPHRLIRAGSGVPRVAAKFPGSTWRRADRLSSERRWKAAPQRQHHGGRR